MEAILSQSDGHGETKTVHAAHGSHRKLLSLLGGYTLQTRNTDSWEGWYWGAKHVWGCENIGQMVPVTNVVWDVSKNSDGILFWGCDPETTPWGFNGQLASRLCYWWTRARHQVGLRCPDCNYGDAVHADKWIPVLPNTDAALYLAIAHVWMTEGTYDKEYVEDPFGGLRQISGLCPRQRRRRSEDAQVGLGDHRCALVHHQGARKILGQEQGVASPSATAAPA